MFEDGTMYTIECEIVMGKFCSDTVTKFMNISAIRHLASLNY